jgi:hypothetical protein
MDDIAVGGENLNAGDGREVTIIGDDLYHAMVSHGFEDEQVVTVDFFGL